MLELAAACLGVNLTDLRCIDIVERLYGPVLRDGEESGTRLARELRERAP